MRRMLVAVVVAIGAVPLVAATTADPCLGWEVNELASGLGMVENLEPDRTGGMLLSSTDRDQVERLSPDGTVAVAFADVPGPGGLRVTDDVLFVNTGDTAQAGAVGTDDGTIQRIDLATEVRETWVDGLVMPNGLELAADGTAFTSRNIGLDGAVMRVLPDPPREAERWAEIRDTNGLAIDAAEEWLYVTTTFDPLAPVNRVRLDDPTQIELVANLSETGVPVVKGLDDMTIDGDDVLYVTANGSGEVLRLDPATGEACVLASGLGNPTAVKFGAGPGWEPDHLYVTAWDGIVRELVPPAGAEPTPVPDDPAPDDDQDTAATPAGGGSLAATGGGVALAAGALLALAWMLRRRGT